MLHSDSYLRVRIKASSILAFFILARFSILPPLLAYGGLAE
ncbi:hypothetical protein SOHN41_03984 [Shewanella sp. HN-41]|nr:hypothetical protein SOHN41_03984 [Shewanella sp. HN-41]